MEEQLEFDFQDYSMITVRQLFAYINQSELRDERLDDLCEAALEDLDDR